MNGNAASRVQSTWKKLYDAKLRTNIEGALTALTYIVNLFTSTARESLKRVKRQLIIVNIFIF